MTLSVLVASSGRPTLRTTLESIAPQLLPGDELLVKVNNNAPWGHAARNELMDRARGDMLAFQDDDDIYAAGALDAIRQVTASALGHVHIFRMKYGAHSQAPGAVIWQREELVEGQVSTGTIVVPNVKSKLGKWGSEYAGDFAFLASTAALYDDPPIWHEDIVTIYRP